MMTKQDIKNYFQNSPRRYDNETYERFLVEAGIPKLPPAIHITGTNGKGSSAHYLAKVFEESGYLVGKYTSPHFTDVNELATINGIQISDEEISNQIIKYDALFQKYELSLFEMMTFISFNYFVTSKCDYVIVEVGMGGIKDATNIFTPLLSIITNIALDHTKELGTTLKDIAMHKAGIIKNNVPLLCGALEEEAENIIVTVAQTRNAPLYRVENDYEIVKRSVEEITFISAGTKYVLGSGAKYEVRNAKLVLEATKVLQKLGVNLNNNAIKTAFLSSPDIGRFSVLSHNPLVIADGAHNPHAISAILSEVSELKMKIKVIFAAFRDKDYQKELALLQDAGAEIVLTTFPHPRAKAHFEDSKLPFYNDYKEAIKQTLNTIDNNTLLLIMGSLYFSVLVTKEWREAFYV